MSLKVFCAVVSLLLVVCWAGESDGEFCDATPSSEGGDCGCNGPMREGNVEKRAATPLEGEEDELVVTEDDNGDQEQAPVPRNKLVLIPGGVFKMGLDKAVIPSDGETPSRIVHISEFYMDKYEVSNAEFAAFIKATSHITDAEKYGNSFVVEYFLSYETQAEITQAVANAPWWLPVDGATWDHPEGVRSTVDDRLSYPVVHVSWNDAKAYCEWAGKRLPTEAEWEYSARAGLKDRLFPWGNNPFPGGIHQMNIWQGVFPDNNTMEDGYAGTAPVNTYEPNRFGLHNMAGNVWEWVADWWTIKHSDEEQTDPTGPPTGNDKVKKGGSFLCHKDYCYRYRCASRSQNAPDDSAYNLGFRCAKSVTS
jgi:sulfatase modifying factor 1